MKIRQFIPMLAIFASPMHAQTAAEFCPAEITAQCLSDIADHVIAAVPDDEARASIAVRHAEVNFGQTAPMSADDIPANADWRALRRFGRTFAGAGQPDEARDLFWQSAQMRANDPNERVKVLDILLIADDAAEMGDLALAQEVHVLAAAHLPGMLAGFVPLSEELRLTRLMALYGWPEAAHPILDEVYPKLVEIGPNGTSYGFTLTRLMEIFILVSREDLLEQAEADLAAYLAALDPQDRVQVQRSHVTALAQAGRVDEAQELAVAYGLDFSETMRNVSHFFLQDGSEYYPGIPDDILRRFELMLAAIDAPDVRGEFLNNLASRLIQDDEYAGIEALLPRVEGTAARSDMVLSLMTYYSREQDDPKAAADLFFAQDLDLSPKFPHLGTFLQQYPLSLTARGLLDAGDTARGVILADLVLQIWLSDQTDRRTLDTSLVGALARAQDLTRVDQWFEASDDPAHQLAVVVAATGARAQAGLPVNRDAVVARAATLLPLISDAVGPAPVWWPADRPYPSPRDEAQRSVDRLDVTIADSLAKSGALPQARMAFADIQDFTPYPWSSQLVLADAEAADGQLDVARQHRLDVLDMVLQGQIEAREMPYIAKALYSE